MKFRALHRLLALLVIGLTVLPALAQSGDAAANSKIDEAINNYYLMMQLDKAEQELIDAAAECGDSCSPEVKAKAWMYVGIVRGSGKTDQAGAAEAFSTAKGIDPNVQLDADLASDETKATFESTTGNAAAAEPLPPEPAPEPPQPAATSAAVPPGALPPPAGVPGDMMCSPQGAPIGVNMPIPVSCSSNATISEGFIKFQEPGSSEWKKISLTDMNGLWQAEIPCKYTSQAGTLKFYVGVKDSSGEYIDQFGSKKEPGSIELTPDGAAPAYPGQTPVTACVPGGGLASSDCPPDFPGCGNQEAVCGDLDWGASCKNSSQCKCGLLCESGACATAPTCSTDGDCDTGACVDGYCSAVRDPDGKGGAGFKRHWLSLTFGMDFVSFPGNETICSRDHDLGIQCYSTEDIPAEGVEVDDRVYPEGPEVGGGLLPGQLRIKLGYDFALTPHMMLGVRAGFAFLNTRPQAPDEVPYLPVHAAARFTYAILPLNKKGFRPQVYAEGGLAEVNAKLVTDDVEVYKVAGYGYAAGGVTLGYMFEPNFGLNLDAQAQLLFPGTVAFALHPALSFVYGF